MLNKIQEDIEVNKELITNLPRNNVKNAKKVLEKILELQNDYQIKLQDVIKEMDSRFNKYLQNKVLTFQHYYFQKIVSYK